MVSRAVGTCFPRTQVMGMRFLGQAVTRSWRKIVGPRFHEVMGSTAGAVGKIEDPLVREIGEGIRGNPPMVP